MTSPDIPPQAITDAHRAFCLALERSSEEPGHSSEDWVRAALKAAAPHLVAAERERLAGELENASAWFADRWIDDTAANLRVTAEWLRQGGEGGGT